MKKYLTLFCNSEFMAVSDDRSKLRSLGGKRINHGVSDGFCIMEIEGLIKGAYII